MLEAIAGARQSVALEIYTLEDSEIGARFRSALAEAARRGVRVRVLVDTFGSLELRADYLAPVNAAGGDCRWFNPSELGRFTYRDHRKLLIVDETVAFVTGFNIGSAYDGDGVTEGWRDLGVIVRGGFVGHLSHAFHGMFGAASFKHRRLARFRRQMLPQRIAIDDGDLFLLSPGRGRNPALDSLVRDVETAASVQLTSAYFLPPRRLRDALCKAARRGTRIQLLLPGKCDVKLAQMAARGQYMRLLRAGAEIYEYQAAILHAKRYILDDVVYVGSANLDLRSLNINYEILLRMVDRDLAGEGRAVPGRTGRSTRSFPEIWQQQALWSRIRTASTSVRIDARFAIRQLSRLRDPQSGLPGFQVLRRRTGRRG